MSAGFCARHRLRNCIERRDAARRGARRSARAWDGAAAGDGGGGEDCGAEAWRRCDGPPRELRGGAADGCERHGDLAWSPEDEATRGAGRRGTAEAVLVQEGAAAAGSVRNAPRELARRTGWSRTCVGNGTLQLAANVPCSVAASTVGPSTVGTSDRRTLNGLFSRYT